VANNSIGRRSSTWWVSDSAQVALGQACRLGGAHGEALDLAVAEVDDLAFAAAFGLHHTENSAEIR